MIRILTIILRIISWLPLRAIHAIGSLTGRLVFRFSARIRKTTLTNIERCFPELNQQARQRLAINTLRETGKTLTEMGVMWYGSKNRLLKLMKTQHGRDLHDQAMAAERGLLCLTPHIGCWEICNLVLSMDHPFSCLYRPPRQEALHRTIKNTRERFGTVMVPTSAAGIKTLFRALKQGEMAAILPDQDPGKDAGIYTRFFGVPCNTLPLIGRLIQKTGAEVMMVYALRLPNGQGYEMFIEPVPKAMFDPDPQVSAQVMVDEIERIVRKAPEQYQWTYKRFKYQPDGKPFYSR